MKHRETTQLRLIENPSPPYKCVLTHRNPQLTVVSGGRDMTEAGQKGIADVQAFGADATVRAFETVEASLKAENWFFETVRKELEKTAPLSEFPTVTGSNGHDYLLHFTQFLFFLKALDCTDADQISNYIEAHNAKIETDLKDPGFTKSANEFRKAIFRPERKAKILDTIRMLRRPVFAIYEYGLLMINDMSPKTTEKLIEDLRYGKLLVRRTDDRLAADQKRILIDSSGFLEDAYLTSLLMQRRMIAHSLSTEEIQRAKE